MTPQALDALRACVGADQGLGAVDLSAWEQDGRKRWRGKAGAVVRPASAEQVAAVVKACINHGLSLVPQGGNTGLVGGGVPDTSGSQGLLSLARLNRVGALAAANLAITPEAGDVIKGTGGVRKMRWAGSGRGKRGGLRVIYYLRLQNGQIWLLTAYAKNVKDNIPASVLKKIKEELDGSY